jgi:hypothetical protein
MGRIRKQPKPWTCDACDACGQRHPANTSAHVVWEDQAHPMPPVRRLFCTTH